jgi:pantothenate kinase
MQQVISDSSTALISRRQQLKAAGESRRLLVGITGGPGSGKSELALAICREVNRVSGQAICRVVGMDGWHYSRAELDKFPVSRARSWTGSYVLTTLTIFL